MFFGCRDVDAAYAYLLSRGLQPKQPVVTGYGMKQLYVNDPDGYVLCFQWQDRAEAIRYERKHRADDPRAGRAPAVAWYQSIGFYLAAANEDCGVMDWASMIFGEGRVMFSIAGRASDARRREVDLYVYCDDVDMLRARLDGQVEIVQDLYDAFYGMREFIVRDCNRFWITFGQQLPIRGEARP